MTITEFNKFIETAKENGRAEYIKKLGENRTDQFLLRYDKEENKYYLSAGGVNFGSSNNPHIDYEWLTSV